jgi:hypothetical protein
LDQSSSPKKNFWSASFVGEHTDAHSHANFSEFNPSQFFIPGWKGNGLITPSAIAIKNSLNNLSIDALAHFKKSCATSKTIKNQTYNEFLRYAEFSNIDKSLLSQQNDFWLHMQDDTSPLKSHIDSFIKIYCFRAVAIYLFRIKFILDLSKEQKLVVNEDILFNPLSFLGKIFKKDSSTELKCESLQINQYSWYRPSPEYKESIGKIKEAFEIVSLTEIMKIISTTRDDQNYSGSNYSHSLSHQSFGLFINELLVKIPSWLKPEAKNKIPANKACILPTTLNTRFIGKHVTSFALSHWLAQESNIKISQWNHLISPEFEGIDFIDGQFLKMCQELQFLSFLTRVAIEHKYEIIPFICKIMKDKYQNSPEDFGNNQASFLNYESGTFETLYHRIVLNLSDLPKNNPHHYLVSQIQSQKTSLKKDGMIFVLTNQKLFVPSHSDRVEQLLKDFRVEASFNLEELKGKGEIPHFIYVLSMRTQSPISSKHFFEMNAKSKESCLSFEFKGDLTRFNKFQSLVEELHQFTRHKNPVSTPIYFSELGNDLTFEFHQDAIIEGKLISSVTTKDQGIIPHANFFKNLIQSCTSLESFFNIEMLSHEELIAPKKNLTNELLGLRIEPEKQFPLLLIVNQSDPLDVKLELTASSSYRAKVEQFGTVYYHYFGLTPKTPLLNLNVFREFFNSALGHQIIQMLLTDGPTKLKAKLKSILIPSFFANTIYMPSEVLSSFALLDLEHAQIQEQHPSYLIDELSKTKSAFLKYAQTYPWHILSLLSNFKLQLVTNTEGELNKSSEINFGNPLLSQELVKLKTHSIYPKSDDVHIEYKIKTHQELQLPLTSLQVKNEDDIAILTLKSTDKAIIELHARPLMIQFIKFILNRANGVSIANILTNLRIPSCAELEVITQNVEQIKNTNLKLLEECEQMISQILRSQISK